jgi:glutaconyl-CoA/methylmalonyl-CoA decarboxylase subunit delta
MDNLGWGVQISVLGMGFVFALLALLWGLLTLVLRFDRPVRPGTAELMAPAAPPAPASELPGSSTPARPAGPAAPPLDPSLVAAITVAVLEHTAHSRKAAAPDQRLHWPGSLLHASRWVASGRLRQNRTFRKGRG